MDENQRVAMSNHQTDSPQDCNHHHKPHMHNVHALSSAEITARLKAAQQKCVAQEIRFTPLRQDVYKLLLESDKPLGAYDLVQSLQANRAKNAGDKAKMVAPPTIYRTLDFLMQFGVIHQLTSINAFVPCCHPRGTHNAVFLLCNHCKSVQECSDLPVQGVVDYVKSSSGFAVEQSVMELKGKCNQCRTTPQLT